LQQQQQQQPQQLLQQQEHHQHRQRQQQLNSSSMMSVAPLDSAYGADDAVRGLIYGATLRFSDSAALRLRRRAMVVWEQVRQQPRRLPGCSLEPVPAAYTCACAGCGQLACNCASLQPRLCCAARLQGVCKRTGALTHMHYMLVLCWPALLADAALPLCVLVCDQGGPRRVLIVKKPVPAAAAQLEEMATWLQQQGLQVGWGEGSRGACGSQGQLA
jgi:hypothetical protein